MKVYEKVRAYLEENGLEQSAVAEIAGIPYATFNAIMSGEQTMYANDLRAICLALHVCPEMFIEYASE